MLLLFTVYQVLPAKVDLPLDRRTYVVGGHGDLELAPRGGRCWTRDSSGWGVLLFVAILRRKVPESEAFEGVTTGERISAERVERLGLVNRVFGRDEFETAASRLLEALAKKPASALELSKARLYELDGAGFEDAIRMGAGVNAVARRTDACREDVRRFLDRSRS